MVKDSDIPFEVGQLAETRSFLPGYRGAWFRCKITKISWRKDRIGHVLHYIDFPDEKEEWTESYQMPPPIEPNRKRKEPPIGQKMGTEKERQIMLRPPYPPIYRDNQLPLAGAISEVIVITEGIWYVGDLVDWWKDGCYWSGKVMQILSNEEAVVELMPPPMGEGQSYNVSFSDLRPSLEWSPEDGWTVPTPKEGNYRQCARLVYPGNQTFVSRLALEVPAKCEVTTDQPSAIGSSSALALGSHIAVGSPGEIGFQSLPKEVLGPPETSKELVPGFSGSDSPEKKFKACGKVPLNSTKSDTLEAAIVDLEELANKLKWLKGILKFGIPLSNAATPSWKLLNIVDLLYQNDYFLMRDSEEEDNGEEGPEKASVRTEDLATTFFLTMNSASILLDTCKPCSRLNQMCYSKQTNLFINLHKSANISNFKVMTMSFSVCKLMLLWLEGCVHAAVFR